MYYNLSSSYGSTDSDPLGVRPLGEVSEYLPSEETIIESQEEIEEEMAYFYPSVLRR